MFVRRNVRKRKGKIYESVLLVQGVRVPAPRGPGRPKKGEKRKTVVRHKVLANLSNLPALLIERIEEYCVSERAKQGRAGGGQSSRAASGGERSPQELGEVRVRIGAGYGPMAAMLSLARECGIERALGKDRRGRMAMFLVLARVLSQGSRLSASRWAQQQGVAELLGLESISEDSLYRTLDWLEERHGRIESALWPGAREGSERILFLYDVTSSYFEGQQNELSEHGYNRDLKRYKKQIVVGLLTDASGDPVSVRVYKGNTNDVKTFPEQIGIVSSHAGGGRVAMVADRGVLRAGEKKRLSAQGICWLTGLSEPEARTLIKKDVIQLGLFDETVREVVMPDGIRYLLRRNPQLAERHRQRRQDQMARVRRKVEERNEKVACSKRCKPQVSLKQARELINTYNLNGFLRPKLQGRRVALIADQDALSRRGQWDGCYVLTSNVPVAEANAQTLWNRYHDLQKVEQDFSFMKTRHLEIRPIYLRKANRTRAHVLVTMLALKVLRKLRRRVAPLGLTAKDALDRLSAIRLIKMSAGDLSLWRLPHEYGPLEQEVLDVLPALPPPMLSRGEHHVDRE